MFPELMHGCIIQHYPFYIERVKKNRVAAHSEIAPEKCFRGEAWIPQRTETLLTQKQLRKTESLASKKSS
jgi:N-acetyl-anhydromuramyl-L-alanine amidase AmpD